MTSALALTLAVYFAGDSLRLGWQARGWPQAIDPDSVNLLHPVPSVFHPYVSERFAPPERELSRILRRVEPLPSGMPASLCLHALAAHGLDAKFENDRIVSGRELLRLFTDDTVGRAYFGAPLMFRTRYGLRVKSDSDVGAAREKHYDQTLGCFAQLGLPLSQSIRVDGLTMELRDVLRDSIASFDLRQSEIEWTAIAYASYLPPYRVWANKFGERFSFDQLADELIGRDLSKASCCGCHVVEAVLHLLRVDREVVEVLSPDVRRQLTESLRRFVRSAVTEQADDGSWGPRWFHGVSATGTTAWPDVRRLESRLLATSHIAHWLMYLPLEMRVSGDVLKRAEIWLYENLKDVTDEFVLQNFCPCSHGAWVLRIASWTAPPNSAAPRESSPNSLGAAPIHMLALPRGDGFGSCVMIARPRVVFLIAQASFKLREDNSMNKKQGRLAAIGVMGLSGYLLLSNTSNPVAGKMVSDNVAADLRGGCQGTAKAACARTGLGCLGGTKIIGGATSATGQGNVNCGTSCGSFFSSTTACAAS